MKHLTLNERDLRALRTFKAVAHAGGFSAAEKALNMTTATISRQIKDIEERLDVTLCTRGPQGFSLTEVGEVALSYVEDAFDAFDRILPAINRTRSILSGELRIGLLDKVIENPGCHLSEALKRLAKEAPDVNVSLETLSKGNVFKSLTNNKVHIIIEGETKKLSSLNYYYLFDEVQKMYRRPTGRKFRELPLICRPTQTVLTEIIQVKKYKKGPSAYGLQSVAALVATGEFMGMLPTHYAKELAQNFTLEIVPDSPTYTIPFYAVTNPTRPLPLCAERFIAILEACHVQTSVAM